MGATPWYSVFRAGDLSVVCYRAVNSDPAQVGDFISHAELGANFPWWKQALAIGLSAWEDREKAEVLAARKGMPFLAELDLARIDAKLPWARTLSPGHVTVWAPATLLIQGVVSYVPVR